MPNYSWKYGDSTLVRGDGDPNTDSAWQKKQPFIRNLQTDLNSFGTKYNVGKVDGIYGPATERAVRDFQSDHEWLDPDGKFGANTKEALYSEVR